jgi:hypothetical protein
VEIMNNKKVSRRVFAKGLVLTPLGLAATGSILGNAEAIVPWSLQDAEAALAQKKAPKSDAEYNRHPPIHETEPFAEPLTFIRAEMQPRVRPFALSEVSLEAGALKNARDWNRSYMMRLPNDRFLHNFRVTAGLP